MPDTRILPTATTFNNYIFVVTEPSTGRGFWYQNSSGTSVNNWGYRTSTGTTSATMSSLCDPYPTLSPISALSNIPIEDTAIAATIAAVREIDRKRAELRAKRANQRFMIIHKRAENILLENLDAKQKRDFEKLKSFLVEGSNGGLYRIQAESHVRNVLKVIKQNNQEKHVERLCAHLDESVGCPTFDHILAQKLLIETDENLFRITANITKLRT